VSGVHDLDEKLEKKKKPRLLDDHEKQYFSEWDYPEYDHLVEIPQIVKKQEKGIPLESLKDEREGSSN